MSESITITPGADKERRYLEILPQIQNLIEYEEDTIANLANVSAVLKEAFNFFWVGFYLVKNETLVLGPFQGSLACTRISKGKGVCGTAWEKAQTQIVPDVDLFPGHIACSSLSRSEIVVPLIKSNVVYGVLDIDSDEPDSFDSTDAKYLEQLSELLNRYLIINP